MTSEDKVCTRLREVIHRLVTDGKMVARLDNTEHVIFPVAVSGAEGNALRDWVVKESVARTIEIGLAYGVSALFVCEGLLMNGHANAQNVVIDPFQSTGYKDCGLQSLDEAGVAHLIEYHAEESQTLLPKFFSEGRRFEMAFVDGSHLFERVFLDLIYLGRLIEPGGIIFIDDYQLPAIAKCVAFCLTNLSWAIEEVSQPDELHQWAVLRTPRNAISRSFRDFVDF